MAHRALALSCLLASVAGQGMNGMNGMNGMAGSGGAFATSAPATVAPTLAPATLAPTAAPVTVPVVASSTGAHTPTSISIPGFTGSGAGQLGNGDENCVDDPTKDLQKAGFTCANMAELHMTCDTVGYPLPGTLTAKMLCPKFCNACPGQNTKPVAVSPAPTKAPATPAPTNAPATPAPTKAPATPAPTNAPATPAPTASPAPTKSPATPTPTASPAPTKAPTATGSAGSFGGSGAATVHPTVRPTVPPATPSSGPDAAVVCAMAKTCGSCTQTMYTTGSSETSCVWCSLNGAGRCISENNFMSGSCARPALSAFTPDSCAATPSTTYAPTVSKAPTAAATPAPTAATTPAPTRATSAPTVDPICAQVHLAYKGGPVGPVDVVLSRDPLDVAGKPYYVGMDGSTLLHLYYQPVLQYWLIGSWRGRPPAEDLTGVVVYSGPRKFTGFPQDTDMSLWMTAQGVPLGAGFSITCVVKTPGPFGAPAQSAKTCAQLAWPRSSAMFNDWARFVCSADALAAGGALCAGASTFAQADALCKATGARVCSTAELAADVALRGACKLDSERVWTSDSCGVGQQNSAAGSRLGTAANPAKCLPSTTLLPVRCCADENQVISGATPAPTAKTAATAAPTLASTTPTTPTQRPATPAPTKAPEPVAVATSSKTCEALGWSTSGGSPWVCAESKLGVGASCTAVATFSAAANLCAALGARLCTAAELAADEAKGTGCKLDDARVWTSSPCGDRGVLTTCGSARSLEAVPPQCSDRSAATTASVRCCADAKGGSAGVVTPPSPSGAKTCAQLGWGKGYGSPTVCADSKINNVCNADQKYADAVALCASAGARLCTAKELEADEARETGCKFDSARVWSSTKCGTQGGVITTAGSTDNKARIPNECTSDLSGVASVRCCAGN